MSSILSAFIGNDLKENFSELNLTLSPGLNAYPECKKKWLAQQCELAIFSKRANCLAPYFVKSISALFSDSTIRIKNNNLTPTQLTDTLFHFT